jgi:hypothetical protein
MGWEAKEAPGVSTQVPNKYHPKQNPTFQHLQQVEFELSKMLGSPQASGVEDNRWHMVSSAGRLTCATAMCPCHSKRWLLDPRSTFFFLVGVVNGSSSLGHSWKLHIIHSM